MMAEPALVLPELAAAVLAAEPPVLVLAAVVPVPRATELAAVPALPLRVVSQERGPGAELASVWPELALVLPEPAAAVLAALPLRVASQDRGRTSRPARQRSPAPQGAGHQAGLSRCRCPGRG